MPKTIFIESEFFTRLGAIVCPDRRMVFILIPAVILSSRLHHKRINFESVADMECAYVLIQCRKHGEVGCVSRQRPVPEHTGQNRQVLPT